MKFYQLTAPVMFSIMYTAAIFAAEKPASLFQIKDINKLIDEFRMHNNESDGFYREINHTPGYSPLLDLITNYTNKASLGKDLAYSIVLALFYTVTKIRTGENRSMLLNITNFIYFFLPLFIIERAKSEKKFKTKNTILVNTIIYGFYTAFFPPKSNPYALFFPFKSNFFSSKSNPYTALSNVFTRMIAYLSVALTTKMIISPIVTTLLSGSRLRLTDPEKITINDNTTVSIYGRLKHGNVPTEIWSLPNMKKVLMPTFSLYYPPDRPITQVTRNHHTYTLENGNLSICLSDDRSDQPRNDFHHYPAPAGTTTFDVSTDEKYIALLTPKTVHLWEFKKSKPLDEIMNPD